MTNNFPNNNVPYNNMSLFDEVSKKIQESKVKNTEEVIEEKMKERNENLFNQKVKSKIEDVRTEVEDHEISLRKNNREEKFDRMRRLAKMTTSKISKSLLDKLQVDKDFYEKCNEIEVTPDQFGLYLSKFRDMSSLENQYYGLIGMRKLSSLSK